MFDRVTVAYRGAKFEIGRGRDFYGIWTAGGSRSQPLERWPETPEGWSAAWTRFTEIEEPGTIAPAGRKAPPPGGNPAPMAGNPAPMAGNPAPMSGNAASLSPAAGAGGGAVVAALLLVAGVALGVAGLFPTYIEGASLAQQPTQLVPHVSYLAVWSASAVLILLGGTWRRLGALLGSGMSIVTFGMFFADAGTPIAGGAHLAGAGIWLSLAGWLACAAGSVAALLLRPAGPQGAGAHDSGLHHGGAQSGRVWRGLLGPLGVPRGAGLGPAILLVLAGLGVAAAFAPAWDSFTLRTAAGQTQTVTAGNAFSNPAPVIAGNVAVMVALAAVVIAAALWRPVRHGAVLLAGATIAMAAQAISALVQVGEATSPVQFGITPGEATRLGLTIDAGLTSAFWVYCGFLIVLAVSCAWMLFMPQTPQTPLTPQASYPAPGPAQDVPAGAGTQNDAYGWNPDAYTWYASAPDTTGVSSVRAPVPGEDHAHSENDKPAEG